MNENKDKIVTESQPETVPYIVHEAEAARAERHIRRLIIALVIAFSLLFASNVIWLYEWMSYDYVGDTVTVDSNSSGNANYIGNDGDINNGKDSSAENTQNEE